MKTLRSLLVSLLTLAAVACGETPADPGQTAPLAVVSGTIATAGKDVTVQGALRTAIVWFNLDEGKLNAISVAQDVAVAPQLPASFSLTLTDPPPSSVVYSLHIERETDTSGPDYLMRGAFGLLVAYEDRNGNGTLDLSKQGDAAYTDRVVGNVDGENPRTFIVWVEPGDVDSVGKAFWGPDGSRPRAGYNLLVDDAELDEHWVDPASHPLKVTLDDSPEMQMLLCVDGKRSYGYTSQPAPTEVPEWPGASDPSWLNRDPNSVSCPPQPLPDGITVEVMTYDVCTSPNEVCVLKRECVSYSWRKPTDPAKAADWPCPTGGSSN